MALNMSSRRSTVGYLKCSTAEGTLTAHTSVRTGAGWKRQKQALEPGAFLELNFAKILVGPLGYIESGRPDTSYMRPAGEPRPEDAPSNYEMGFSVPVYVARIGWLDCTSSSRYLTAVIEYLYNNYWEAVENRKDTLSVTFNGFLIRHNKQYGRDYYVPDLQPHHSSQQMPQQSNDDPDDGIPF
jgi:hypothetical protein